MPRPEEMSRLQELRQEMPRPEEILTITRGSSLAHLRNCRGSSEAHLRYTHTYTHTLYTHTQRKEAHLKRKHTHTYSEAHSPTYANT